jgi:hypothetical protein
MSNTDLPEGAVLLPQANPQRRVYVNEPSLPPGATLIDDKYTKAAQTDLARPMPYGMRGYTGRVGMGIPWSDEIMAAAMTPIEMVRQGTTDPAEAYRYAKTRENLLNEQTRANTPGALGIGAEVAGGLATGAGVLGSGPRAAAATIGGVTIPAKAVNYATNIGKAGGLGVVTGAGEGDTLKERARGALIGGGIGTALGATVPLVAPTISNTARLFQIPRLRNPEKVATEQLAKVARDAGVSMEDLGNTMAAARAAGQTDFTVADALKKEGQRKLAGLAKTPGPAREQITEVLTARDLNMPQRVGEEVGRKLGAPYSAQASRDALIDRASTRAAPLYRQAEGVTTWSPKLEEFWKHPDVQKGLAVGVRRQARDAVGTGQPFDPNHYGITNFNAAGDPIITGVPNMKSIQAAKVGLDEMIDANRNEITGRLTAEGRSLANMQRRMLSEIDSINPTYRAARQEYAGPMQIEEAIRFGQQMPTQGRAVDNVRQFEARTPSQQQGIRIGVADKVRGDLERTGNLPTYLREKSIKGQTELEAMSPYGPATLREALAREEIMQRTSRAALGGPQTAENLADMAQVPGGAEALGVAGKAIGGNIRGALSSGWDLMKRVHASESSAQREAIARALLSNDPASVAAMQARIAEHELRRRGVNPFVTRPPRYRPGE